SFQLPALIKFKALANFRPRLNLPEKREIAFLLPNQKFNELMALRSNCEGFSSRQTIAISTERRTSLMGMDTISRLFSTLTPSRDTPTPSPAAAIIRME